MKAMILVLVSATASAEPRVEIGGALGAHAFSRTTELGVPDVANEPGPASAGMIGLRLGVQFTDRIAVEGEAMAIPTHDDVLHDGVMVYGLRAHVRFDVLTGRIKPFLVAGAGMHVLRSSSPQMDNDVDQAYHWGAGVRYAITDAMEVRLDARHLIVPDRTINGATSDLEVSLGFTYRFGGEKTKPTPPPPPVIVVALPPAPIDPDTDGDGIPDSQDKCPMDPETKNGYEDQDGCPDRVIEELAGIGFELDSAKIDISSAPILEKAYDILTKYPDLSIEISGHTSSDGDPNRNFTLSLSRAEAVKAYLVKRGIQADRILTVGHGSEVPVADNTSEDGRRKNRRIEFRILTPDEVK